MAPLGAVPQGGPGKHRIELENHTDTGRAPGPHKIPGVDQLTAPAAPSSRVSPGEDTGRDVLLSTAISL